MVSYLLRNAGRSSGERTRSFLNNATVIKIKWCKKYQMEKENGLWYIRGMYHVTFTLMILQFKIILYTSINNLIKQLFSYFFQGLKL